MRTVVAEHWGPDNPARALLGKKPEGVPDGFVVLEPPAVLVDPEGAPVGVYLNLRDPSIQKIEHVLANSKPKTLLRTGGLPGTRVMFGSAPRLKIRQDYCRYTADSVEYAHLMPMVQALAVEVCDLYREALPVAYAEHERVSSAILPEWRFPGTPFCSCNFNYNFAIPYHRDSGNQPGVYSNVLVARKGVLGGQLVLPEFGAALAMRNGHLVIFDGTKVIHGVTPIRRLSGAATGYRCSIVLYSMRGMDACLCSEEEHRRAQLERTQTEARWRIDRGTE